MPSSSSDPEPTPVPPPPIESSPSATGVIDGDEEEVVPAPPAENAGERRDDR